MLCSSVRMQHAVPRTRLRALPRGHWELLELRRCFMLCVSRSTVLGWLQRDTVVAAQPAAALKSAGAKLQRSAQTVRHSEQLTRAYANAGEVFLGTHAAASSNMRFSSRYSSKAHPCPETHGVILSEARCVSGEGGEEGLLMRRGCGLDGCFGGLYEQGHTRPARRYHTRPARRYG